jgi:ketosteroid isomerase-like protein
MKKAALAFFLAMSCMLSVTAQKKTNGTIYIEHPAIKTVEDFIRAFLSKDNTKLGAYLSSDFKWYNGTTGESNDKTTFLNNLLPIDQFDYFSLTPMPGSYPDAFEYQKDNKDGDVAVAGWYVLKGVHKNTGVKVDAPAHFQLVVTKDNKIKQMTQYSDSEVFGEISRSTSNRTNGKIYNHHENINTMRKAMYAWEKGDLTRYLSFYNDDAKFYDINDEWGTSRGKAEEKTSIQNFLKEFEIKSIEVVGYPDYLEYEMSSSRNVLSWWKVNLVRKSDQKAIILPMHLSQGFDEQGKITHEIAYYSAALLTK